MRRIHRRTQGRVPVIGVGGVMGGDEAFLMLAAGASLVQAYTGFVYSGPTFAGQVKRGLAARMRREGVASVAELVGRDA